MMRMVWLSLLVLLQPAFAGENNLQVTGTLVSEPCTLDPASSAIELNFGNLVGKYFYTADRTPGEPFEITLKDCNTALGSGAIVTFKGTESASLPGLLVPDDGDTHGIAFGIETGDAQPVALNAPSPAFALTDGTNTLALRGYVQAEPAAIAAHAITAGAFTATATFEIEYP